MHITLICADEDGWAIGLRSISASLRRAGHATRIVLAGGPAAAPAPRTLAELRGLAASSGLIGVSSMSRSSRRAKSLIEALRPLGRPIVWGGMHPTLYPEDCVGHADLICRGEGEDFMVDLAGRLSRGEGFLDIPNGGYRRDGRTVFNDVRPLLADLDGLPFVDFSFAGESRIDHRGRVRPNGAMKEERSILFTGSRGCAFSCHYCSNDRLKTIYEGKGRYVRKMSVRAFVAAAKRCRDLFPRARYIYFTDEDFLARPLGEFREFAAIYPGEVGLPFECMASPQQISDEKMALLVKAGLWRVDVGVESGSDRIKKEIFNRQGSNDIVLRAASVIGRYPGVVAYYFFIIGNPYEGRDDLLGTVDLIRRLPAPAFIRTYNLVFIPGTKLFDRACRDGIISGLADSGFEIDFLSGFDYRGQAWKKNNLYLNGLVSLMTGKATRWRIGFVPRPLLPLLLSPSWLDFNDRHVLLSKALIGLGRGGLKLRRRGLLLVSKVLKDPRSAYNVRALAGKPAGPPPASSGPEAGS
ncbi:MAG TPA: radical SAM protein [Candidatus Aminicenantes bacterium]|nr:radical SAM protein [Candidatus Aminicenantes bacterium]HRY64850.1 radical SAM protein [Candidatus Aminicenantes bacterium]HRZ71763.1 radical SAM protein [Candidatus Aminicenantes bacterium]